VLTISTRSPPLVGISFLVSYTPASIRSVSLKLRTVELEVADNSMLNGSSPWSWKALKGIIPRASLSRLL